MSIRCARGTKDVLPAEIPTWHFLEDVARDLAEDYGYREIRTPMFESPDLFLKGMGATAGLVERELWTFHDKHGRKLALRPDLTAPTVRACHDHGLLQPETGPTRLYYLGSVFMHGREREVESRQLHQFGLEALGSKDPALDAEVLVMVSDLCSALGLPDIQIQLNSLGCKKCRPAYHQLLKDYFGGRQEELCRTCKRRYRTHPLWTLGCQSEPCLELSRVAPSIFGTLCPDCRNHFSALKTYLKELKIEYRLNPLVVRDLEYYDRTIFQVTCAGRPVAFGGRYDELSSVLGGPATPAVGCSVDLEPLLEAMHEAGLDAPAPEPPRVCLAGDGEEAVSLLLPIVYALRRSGVRADLVYPMKAEETALQAAERVTSPLLVLLEEDVRRRLVTLVEADRGRRQQVRLEEAVSRIGRELGLEGLKDELRPVEIRRVSLGRRRRPVRSRALYGADIPRLSRTSSTRSEAEEEGEQGRRRRRRRSTRGEEAEVSRSASTPGASDETPKRSRKRRRSRSGSEAATGEGEAGRPTVASGGEASSKQAVERSRRSRRRRKESEDSLEAAAAAPGAPESVPQDPGDESAIRDGSRRSGRGRRRRRSDSRSSGQAEPDRRAAQDAAYSSETGERMEAPDPSGSAEAPVSADAAQSEDPTGARRRGRRRSRRGGARTAEAVEAEATPPEPLFAESLGGGAEAPPVLKRRRPSRRASAGAGASEASEASSVSAAPPAEESRGSAADGEAVKPRARRRRTVKSADAEAASPSGEDA